MSLIKHFPLQKTQILPVLIIIGLALLAFIYEKALITTLIYHREYITQGEIWRLISGHFFHTNQNHLILNLAGIVLLWALHGQYYQLRWYLLFFIFSAIFTSTGIYFTSPDLLTYVGLSGILHGVLVIGAIADIKHKLLSGYLLLIGLLIKILNEQIFGESKEMVALINAQIAIDAHLWGAISGVIFALYYWLVKNHSIKKAEQ